MTQVKLYLFGPPRLEYNGELLTIKLRKAMAILVYLAVTRQPHRRDSLATLFWPDKDQRNARANLRRTLYELSQQFEKQMAVSLLTADDESVMLAADVSLWTDVTSFQHDLAESKEHETTNNINMPPTVLIDAAKLYTDDFLAGFTLSDAPDFDDWQFFQREELRQQLSTLLDTLVDWYEAQANYDEAIHAARRWLQLDPLDERVHRRLMTLYAQAGQIATAVRQYDECARILSEELDAPPSEETMALFEAIRTRRLSKPIREDVVRDHPIVQGATSATPQSLKHNLPHQTTPFVGRKQEMAEILHRLSDETCRLLTLIGPGGVGKTRLAIEVARWLIEHNWLDDVDTTTADNAAATQLPLAPTLYVADGVFLVELGTVQGSSGVIAAIAEAVGFRFYSDVPPQEQLMHYLREKQLLLVLDNVEHLLVDANPLATFVADLLATAPRIKLLATSREALNLQEEWFHPLGGLHFSQVSHRYTPNAGTPRDSRTESKGTKTAAPVADAVQLFVQNARRARADFDQVCEDEAVLRICHLVDGMPLALELAAAWIKVLPCARIADEIEQNLDILTTRHQNIPSRHRSMRAVLEQSWQLLTTEEQVILQRLSIFQRGFTQAAAQTIAGASLLTLAGLTEKALVHVHQAGLTHNRYQMHELLRQFATDKFTGGKTAVEAMANNADISTDISTTRTNHSDYYLALLHEWASALLSSNQQQAVQIIHTELDNIRVALLWAITNGNNRGVTESLGPLYNFYQIQSRFLEGKDLFLALLARWRSATNTIEPLGQQIELRLLACVGALSYLLCDYVTAEQHLTEALAHAKLAEMPREHAFVLSFLGRLVMWQGGKGRAKALLTESLHLSQALGDDNRIASTLEKLASLIYATFGEYENSKTLTLESLALSRKLGRPDRIAYALDTLGFVTFCRGEYGESERYYTESLEMFEQTDDQYGHAMALGGLALVYWGLGQGAWPTAERHFQQSLEICRAIGHQGQVVGRLVGLARLANDQGNYAEAQALAQEGLTIARALGSPVYLLHVLYCLGESAYQVRKLADARDYIVEALARAVDTELLSHLAIVLYHYAMLLGKESERFPADAAEQQQEAQRILTCVRDHPATWYLYQERAATQLRGLIMPSSASNTRTKEWPPDLDALARAILRRDSV